jgi:hypothetical protein
MEDTMRPTTAFHANVFDINALLHPDAGAIFDHPTDVLARILPLSVSEKRAILASWASDASAIASSPALRAPARLKRPVTVDAILDALRELDSGPRSAGRQAKPFVSDFQGPGIVKAMITRLPRHLVLGDAICRLDVLMDEATLMYMAEHAR